MLGADMKLHFHNSYLVIALLILIPIVIVAPYILVRASFDRGPYLECVWIRFSVLLDQVECFLFANDHENLKGIVAVLFLGFVTGLLILLYLN